MRVVDVGEKPATAREAIARGRLSCSAAALLAVRRGEVPKGDVIAAARLAGILAAKQTPAIVPLCHPISLSGIDVLVAPSARPSGFRIEARVRTVDRTGVEMEALAAVCGAALCLYDMLKSMDRAMRIERVELVQKRGGRSGSWRRKS
ncbi:MAG: cyclic pyranopterin monophosphate synthase MoaC [Deltaproteobacteria bacterium]